ncbi:CLUMA_CG002903, isoform A [Clunio marinus]|uniref:CLUMA_CG002903, isoform A n=1 Tax=Clunio marinus TaxID=568069 RepID=A0A1J1HRN9_9DIPT|nr:CLUMA_CG002903, isoform A [Clunio marinus]
MTIPLKQNSFIIIDHINMNFNKNITNISYTLQNDGIHSTLINLTIETFYEVVKSRITGSINFPENDRDREYKRQYFKTSLDTARLLKGAFGNSITKALAQKILETKNLTIPLKKGFYYFYDFSIPDIFLPFGSPSRALIKCVYDGKIKREKKTVLGSSWEFFIHRI